MAVPPPKERRARAPEPASEALPLVVPLEQVGAADLALVGGKAANLAEMLRLGLPVPRGFCLTAEAYRRVPDSANDAWFEPRAWEPKPPAYRGRKRR